jgi:hypothetical protein
LRLPRSRLKWRGDARRSGYWDRRRCEFRRSRGEGRVAGAERAEGGIHARGERAIAVGDLEFDGHGAGLGIEHAGDARNGAIEDALGVRGDAEDHGSSARDAAGVFFGNGDDYTKPR